jgi:hypothetical protein
MVSLLPANAGPRNNERHQLILSGHRCRRATTKCGKNEEILLEWPHAEPWGWGVEPDYQPLERHICLS